MQNKDTEKAEAYLRNWKFGLGILCAVIIILNICYFTIWRQADQEIAGNDVETESELEPVMEPSETEQEILEAPEVVISSETTLLFNRNNFLPLTQTVNINVYGYASIHSYDDPSKHSSSFLQGLMNAGFEINTELLNFYRGYQSESTLPEPTPEEYLDEILPNAIEFSSVSILFLARNESQDGQVPDELKSLTSTEQSIFDLLCENFEEVIVIYSGPDGFDFNFAQNHEQVDGIISCMENSNNNVGNVLRGNMNPSGRTSSEENPPYSFGYGQSYTSFSQDMSEVNKSEQGNDSVDVTVINTGQSAGEDVIEIYDTTNQPRLIAYQKTGVIERGALKTVTVELPEVSAGTWEISLGTDRDHMLMSAEYSVNDSNDSIQDEEQEIPQKVVTSEAETRNNMPSVRTVWIVDLVATICILFTVRFVVYVGYIRRKKRALRSYAREMTRKE